MLYCLYYPGGECDATERRSPASCADIYGEGERTSGVYEITPLGYHSILVYCDMEAANGGWTVSYCK